MPDNFVFTPHDLAERWQTTTKVIEAMLRAGDLRGFKIGRRWRISESAVYNHELRQDGAA